MAAYAGAWYGVAASMAQRKPATACAVPAVPPINSEGGGGGGHGVNGRTGERQ